MTNFTEKAGTEARHYRGEASRAGGRLQSPARKYTLSMRI